MPVDDYLLGLGISNIVMLVMITVMCYHISKLKDKVDRHINNIETAHKT